MITMIQSAINGMNPPNIFPGISQCLEGNPKKYFTGSGDLITRYASILVHAVEMVIVAINDPR